MILFAILLIAALFFAWEAKGSLWMLKVLAWSAGSVIGLCALVIAAAEIHAST